jgi:hypothetical protein
MNPKNLGVTCKISEMIVIDLHYHKQLNPVQCRFKANDILCWLILNAIRHEMIYNDYAEEIPVAIGFERSEDALLFKLTFKV